MSVAIGIAAVIAMGSLGACSSQPTSASSGQASDASTTASPSAATTTDNYTSFAAIKNTLACTPFAGTTTPENLGQSTGGLTSHGMRDWQTCHSGDDSFLIVQFDSADDAVTAKDALADGTNTWSYGWNDSPFALFMIHTQALQVAKQTFGDQGAGPKSSSASAGAPTSSGSFFAVDGAVKLVTGDGYTSTLQLTWDGGEPRADVGSNAPGKTNILIAADPFKASLTDTTAGGRALPVDALPSANLVALYPISSAVCTQMYPGDNNSTDQVPTGSGDTIGGLIRSKHFCGIRLTEAIGAGRASSPLGTGSLPNGSPVSYTYDDLADSAGKQAAEDQWAQPVDDGPSWLGVDEAKSVAIRDALTHPLSFGIETYELKPKSTSCTYPNQISGETRYVALIDSNVGTTVPGC